MASFAPGEDLRVQCIVLAFEFLQRLDELVRLLAPVIAFRIVIDCLN